jgi:hypothetical protein
MAVQLGDEGQQVSARQHDLDDLLIASIQPHGFSFPNAARFGCAQTRL